MLPSANTASSVKFDASIPPLWHEAQPSWLSTIDPSKTPTAVETDFFPPPDWPADERPDAGGHLAAELKVEPVVPLHSLSEHQAVEGMPMPTSSSTELFHRVPLGEKGRMELKSAIRAAIKERPELRERVNAVAKLRCATIPQLLKIASICNLWTMALNISRRFMETRNGKQARSSRRDVAALVSPNAADLRRVRPNSKVRRSNISGHDGSSSPASPCPLSNPVGSQPGEWDAGACWTAYDAVQSWISAPSWVSSVPYSLADLGGAAAPPPEPEPAASADIAFSSWNMTSY